MLGNIALHIIIFASVFVALASAASWIIFVRTAGEGLRMGESNEEDRR